MIHTDMDPDFAIKISPEIRDDGKIYLRKLYNYFKMIYRGLQIYLVETQIENFVPDSKL